MCSASHAHRLRISAAEVNKLNLMHGMAKKCTAQPPELGNRVRGKEAARGVSRCRRGHQAKLAEPAANRPRCDVGRVYDVPGYSLADHALEQGIMRAAEHQRIRIQTLGRRVRCQLREIDAQNLGR